ncbi:MAG TPA: PP2C family protein-serine/threonine phosphatase [Streptosporangiaceae bacterium]|nr:PP2C family protein-serine/threonine phosphatase [Streptosporangiaceae bacterium]
MVVKVGRQLGSAVTSAAERQRARMRRQFVTKNRRTAFGLALLTVAIGIGALKTSADWLSPGVMILPVLAGGLLLWPRALRVLFGFVAVMLAIDWVNGKRAGLGIIAAIVVTALFADVLARTRAKLGILGLRGDRMLVELRDRLRAQSRMPELPEGWRAVSVLRPAGGSSFGGDFLVSACDGKVLDVALVDVSGKGIDAGTRALLLSGAFGGLLGSVPHSEYLPACNAYLQRGGPPEGFVTAVHLTLDLVSGDYLISSAGHPPAAQFESGSGRWQLNRARGIVLGVVPELRSRPERGTLRFGDALMLYTDGLVEGPGRDIDAGIDRLLGAADQLITGGFDTGAARLVQTMQGAGPNSDDCALAIIWRDPRVASPGS